MDRSLAPAFEALFCSLSHKDWDLLSPFELNGLSYRNIQVQPGLLQWLINHFDPSGNLFHHNDFKIGPLFKELNIIFGRIAVVEEVPVLPQLDVGPTSLILLVFSFSAYEIPSYGFGADVVPLRLFVDRALSMDRTSPHWPSLICFCILSQYLLLSGIDGYGSLRFVPIVEQTARRRTLFSLILVETFTWLGEHDWDSSSVLDPMGSPLLMQILPLRESDGLAPGVAYYPSRVTRQYGRYQAFPDYSRFEVALLHNDF
ncbi:hypothetical protein JCGZ_10645 [Jatropha curcas]|uniref:Uncharacterized protein n=1 Tax=Jatropha curcas TaxID=180498 RepID=A0A067J8Z3_JATCU|nr:hypothetical protein JCGZ_10645 [Jatropha curcas]